MLKVASLDDVAVRVRQRRTALGLSQDYIATEVGCSQGAVCTWEAAKHMVPPELWDAVAICLRTTIDQLFLDTK